jgi:hypothetical protein
MKISIKQLQQLIKEALTLQDSDVKAYIYVDTGENLSRYASVKKRMTAAGFLCASGSGHGSYGAHMIRTDATPAEATQVLSDASFFDELDIVDANQKQRKRLHYASDSARAYDTEAGHKIWHNAYNAAARKYGNSESKYDKVHAAADAALDAYVKKINR